MTTTNDPAQQRQWSAEGSDGTQYTLTIEGGDGGEVTVSYESPPEYHYHLAGHCSIAEFLDGKLAGWASSFSEAQIAEARAVARARMR